MNWLRPFRHWSYKVADFTSGRTPQPDDVFLATCQLPLDPNAQRYALAVRKIFGEEGSVDPKFIFATDRFPEDLGILPFWDSIDYLHIVFRLEMELKVKINKHPLPTIFTVREFIHALIRTLSDSSPR